MPCAGYWLIDGDAADKLGVESDEAGLLSKSTKSGSNREQGRRRIDGREIATSPLRSTRGISRAFPETRARYREVCALLAYQLASRSANRWESARPTVTEIAQFERTALMLDRWGCFWPKRKHC